jgi:predicted GNAT family acetyltransferase
MANVIDNAAHQRFELIEDGHLAYAAYRRAPGEITIPHVEAAPELRGKGTAGRLMEGIVARARAEGLKVIPICSYAVSWFRRHPDAGDVLK